MQAAGAHRPFFHRGILLLDFTERRDRRRIVQQTFTRTVLQRVNVLVLDHG